MPTYMTPKTDTNYHGNVPYCRNNDSTYPHITSVVALSAEPDKQKSK